MTKKKELFISSPEYYTTVYLPGIKVSCCQTFSTSDSCRHCSRRFGNPGKIRCFEERPDDLGSVFPPPRQIGGGIRKGL